MSKLYTTDAIILTAKDYRDYDKLLTLFSPEHGRISAIVKGVKKPKSKLSGIVQSFTYGRYQLYLGKSLDRLVQGTVYNGFGHLKGDLMKMSAGMCVLELLDKSVLREQESGALFGVTLSCFYLLEKDYPLQLPLRIFEAKLIDHLGYAPDLSGCLHHGEVASARWYFDPDQGGIVCEPCFEELCSAQESPQAFLLERSSLNIMDRLLNSPVYQLKNLKMTDVQNDTVERVFTSILRAHAGITCKTKSFLETMNRS